MSEGERMKMIRGMVARLAERLEDDPDDAAGWERLARSYGTLGEAGRARDAFARAAALDPDNPALLQAYGTAIVKAAPDGAPPPQEAVDVFRRLGRIDGDNRAALWHLGLAAARTGNAAEARALWRRLLGLLAPESAAHAALKEAIERLGPAPTGG
jgi:cytochrome c-type biogenesis protein CcmH